MSSNCYRLSSFFLAIGLLISCQNKEQQIENTKPNVIFILADDLGYGDVQALNAKSKISTPNMNRLAVEGMTFTDAHSNSAVCTPTRYGVLTGRYAWRTRLKRGVLNGYSSHLIQPERTTVADVFKKANYATACIGKWHLGMDMPLKENHRKQFYKINADQKIKNGPNEYGFDYFYGISASLDFPPYVYMENDRFTQPMTDSLPKGNFPAYARAGEKAPDFTLEDCLDVITQKALGFIQKNAQNPFFLYLPLTAPHKPVLPHKRFRGNTDLGEYGDFVTQVDWTVGQVLDKLEELKIGENTLVILTSDNASFMHRIGESDKFPTGSIGHTQDNKLQAFDPAQHTANYVFKGTKADIWEGGHHVPFLARWPNKIKKQTKQTTTICLTDFFSTAAAITGYTQNRATEGEDSFSLLPLFEGKNSFDREPVIHHSIGGMFAIRKANWKLVLGTGSGGRLVPRGKAFEKPYQLFDLQKDISEQQDMATEKPEVVADLVTSFDEIYLRTEKSQEN